MAEPGQRDRVAVLAFVIGCIPFVGAAALVLGIMGRNRTRQRDLEGMGLARAATWLGVFWVAVVFGVGIWASGRQPQRAAGGGVTKDTEVELAKVRPGDCLPHEPEASDETVVVVPCAKPHVAEVFGTSNLPGFTYPGEQALLAESKARCQQQLSSYLGAGSDSGQYSFDYLHPTASGWSYGDRLVVCILLPRDGDELSHSVRDGDAGDGA